MTWIVMTNYCTVVQIFYLLVPLSILSQINVKTINHMSFILPDLLKWFAAKKFCYLQLRLITVITTGHHFTITWASSIWFMCWHIVNVSPYASDSYLVKIPDAFTKFCTITKPYPHYLLTYLLTYSMEQSPSWEANWFCS